MADVLDQFDGKYFDENSIRIGNKTGGIHKGDRLGGVYKKGGKTYLYKRDNEKPENDIAEYFAGQIVETLAPGSGPKIGLIKLNDKVQDLSKNENAFVTSKYHQDGYKDFHAEAGYKDRPSKLEAIQSKLRGQNYVTKKLAEKAKDEKGKTIDGQYEYTNYPAAIVASLAVKDKSLHSGNMGVLTKKDNKLVRIDYGAALRDFTPEIKPFQSIKNRVGFEKNYLLRDHPKERIVSKAFSEELRNQAGIDLNETIDRGWSQIEVNFDKEAMERFNERIGAKDVQDPKEFFKDGFKQIQQSLKNFANEIDLELAVKTKNREIIEAAVRQAEQESPGHLDKILRDPKKSELGTKFSPSTIKELSQILEDITPQTARAQDSLAFDKPIVALGDISRSVEQEINDQQAKALHESIKLFDTKIKPFNKEDFSQYLQDPKNKIYIDKALESEEFKKTLNEIEVKGYEKIHNNYKDILRPIAWDSSSSKDSERLQVLKNDKGEALCTLTETSVEAKGNPPGVSSYRKIDFPIKLDDSAKGPLYVAMALKDEKGKNIAAKDALYFTANYDENGKLTNMSSPMPVKFMGKGDDAIGYIERDGKKYTLPITQKNYNEMAKEVGLDKNVNAHLSLNVAKNKVDKAIKSPPPVPSAPKPELKKQKNIESNNKNMARPASTPSSKTWVKGESKGRG